MTTLFQQLNQILAVITRHPLYLKYGVLLIPFVSVILAGLIFFFLTLPQIFKILDTNTQLQEIQQKHSFGQQKIQVLEKIDLEFYKNNLESTLIALPTDKDIPGAINSILKVISDSGLNLDSFSINPSNTPLSATESFTVKISVSGSLDQLKNLIAVSEKSSRLIKIIGIAVNNSKQTSIQAGLDILVFYAPLETGITTDPNQKSEALNAAEEKILSKIDENRPPSTTQTPLINTPTGKSDPFN